MKKSIIILTGMLGFASLCFAAESLSFEKISEIREQYRDLENERCSLEHDRELDAGKRMLIKEARRKGFSIEVTSCPPHYVEVPRLSLPSLSWGENASYLLSRLSAESYTLGLLGLALNYADFKEAAQALTKDVLEEGFESSKTAPLIGNSWHDAYTMALEIATKQTEISRFGAPDDWKTKHSISEAMVDMLFSYRRIIPCAESPDGRIVEKPQKKGMLWWGLQHQDLFCITRALADGTDPNSKKAPFDSYSALAMAVAGYKKGGWKAFDTTESIVDLLLSYRTQPDNSAEEQFKQLQKKAEEEKIDLTQRFINLKNVFVIKIRRDQRLLSAEESYQKELNVYQMQTQRVRF